MSRKFAIVLMAVAVAFIAAVAFAAAPDTITVDHGDGTKSGVTFSHAKHAADYGCKECHHTAASDAEAGSKGCVECHGVDANIPDVKNAYHDNCYKGCHKQKGAGPTKCKECHP